ncbi:hypothetical protein [Congregibacter litoralis]|uniref:Putative kinase n=1 Tax=Congregibacter litoralis KT71 TaxID=314285 RepID=A4A5N5_9GAMM|nr:hypothetical protein [Congregibacter litoralis]EAQ98332.1 putative kinase [Congregibacter litoralis KT71]
MKSWQQRFLEAHRLQASYLDTARRYFDPLARMLGDRQAQRGASLKVALNGSQGSGKSTLGDYLCAILKEDFGLSAVALSLDDFYLTRAERAVLAENVHPLLQTRGAPGTHDVDLLRRTLDTLGQPSALPVRIPRFDKSADDRALPEDYSTCQAPVDVIILEGWCLGARSEASSRLVKPMNALERDEDPSGFWRNYSNEQLRIFYEPFYDELDFWVMLQAPGFDQVLRWRSEQEQKLRDAVRGQGAGLMDDGALLRFVQHFERCTRQCLRDLPGSVDVLFKMDEDRRIVAVRGLEPGE